MRDWGKLPTGVLKHNAESSITVHQLICDNCQHMHLHLMTTVDTELADPSSSSHKEGQAHLIAFAFTVG